MTDQLTSEVTLPRPLDEVFDFFADASNLEAITPPELRFKILTPLPIEMHPGRLIEYQMSLYGIPFKWQTEISVWEPGVRFVDQQLRGPYKVWIHEPVGRLAHPLVRSKLDRIFSYREQRVAELLG